MIKKNIFIVFCALTLLFSKNQVTAQEYNFHGFFRNQNYWLDKFETKLYANLYLDLLAKNNLKFSAKYRPTFTGKQRENNFFSILDYAYFDLELRRGLFINLGKENVREGVGLSYNPTDFLASSTAKDYSKLEEERRWDREGINLIKLDSFQNNYNFSLVFAEQNKTLLKIYSLIFDSDFSFLFYSGDYPSLGFNFAKNIGENMEMHSEIASQWGSKKEIIEKTSEGYKITNPEDNNHIFLSYIFGGHYTFSNQSNLILEYYFLEDGLNEKNWENLLESLKTNPQFSSLIKYGLARQNYFFMRFNKPQFFTENLNLTLSALKNLDDGSLVINNQTSYSFWENYYFDLGFSFFIGGTNTEFSLVPYKGAYWMGIRRFF